MKKTSAILALMALGVASATAGTAPAPSGKAPAPSGKGPAPSLAVDPCAGPISYNNVELLYANTDTGGYGDSEDGLQLRLEYSPWQNIYVTGAASYTDISGGETWTLSAGIGGYVALTPNIHLAADAGLFHWDSEYDIITGTTAVVRRTVSESDTGWYVRPHVRAKWGCFEAHAGATYIDVDDADDWNWFLQLYYQVAPKWDITAGYSEFDDSDGETWTIGARYKF